VLDPSDFSLAGCVATATVADYANGNASIAIVKDTNGSPRVYGTERGKDHVSYVHLKLAQKHQFLVI
jgi:predicted RNA methylase